MSKNVNDASLANLKHYEGKWKHGQTRTIRVPIILADATLEYARQLDNGVKSHDTSDLGEQVKGLMGEIERLQTELGNLRSQLGVEETRYDELREEWEDKEETCAQLERKLAVARAERDETIAERDEIFTKLAATLSPKIEPPEAADLLNKLKAKRRKATASLADIEAILEILEK
jgi:chromosome segregation ATPase